MTTIPARRQIAIARRELVQTIAAEFHPVEHCADSAAAGAARFVATLIEQRSAAGLKPTVAVDVIELMQEASQFACQARAKVMEAHERMAAIAKELNSNGDEYAPECPPDFFNRGGLVAVG